MKKILVVFGTRPEAIKLAPVIHELRRHPEVFECRVCVTAQHRQMLDQVLELYEIRPDHDLNIMTENQRLSHLTAEILRQLATVMEQEKPEVVLVQGDTTTTFVAALVAYYHKVRVGHVEAGLRTFHKYNPYPEELNRKLCSALTDFHFCPTERNRRILLKEGYPEEQLFVTGNTVVDSLLFMLNRLKDMPEARFMQQFPGVDFSRRIILVTGHRRESFGQEFRNICLALKEIAHRYADVEIIYPVHLNPNVQQCVYPLLSDVENIHLLKPLDYATFVWLMNKCDLILTDSGGIQEEAPTLKKPVVVMRKTTERPEAVESGFAILAGTSIRGIVERCEELLGNPTVAERLAALENPFGDGKAAERIVHILAENG